MAYSAEGASSMSCRSQVAWRGSPIDVVRSETNDFMVPATSEMIIEGEVPLDDMRPEGPYGEMVGYQGKVKQEVFWMRVTAVTHRKDPLDYE